MPIKTIPVQPVRVTYICNTCLVGEMIYSGTAMSNTFGCNYDHHCSKCLTQQSFDAIYPYIDYEDIANKNEFPALNAWDE